MKLGAAINTGRRNISRDHLQTDSVCTSPARRSVARVVTLRATPPAHEYAARGGAGGRGSARAVLSTRFQWGQTPVRWLAGRQRHLQPRRAAHRRPANTQTPTRAPVRRPLSLSRWVAASLPARHVDDDGAIVVTGDTP